MAWLVSSLHCRHHDIHEVMQYSRDMLSPSWSWRVAKSPMLPVMLSTPSPVPGLVAQGSLLGQGHTHLHPPCCSPPPPQPPAVLCSTVNMVFAAVLFPATCATAAWTTYRCIGGLAAHKRWTQRRRRLFGVYAVQVGGFEHCFQEHTSARDSWVGA